MEKVANILLYALPVLCGIGMAFICWRVTVKSNRLTERNAQSAAALIRATSQALPKGHPSA